MTAAADLAPRFNPFPGLRPFEPDEDYLFFGRERQIDELLRKLRTTRFLSILGTSGSGKSSLVRSGLIPTLYGGGMTSIGSRWRVAILRPGEDPLGNLASALSAPGALGPEEEDDGLTRAFFETTLRASKHGLAECMRQARIPPEDHLLVLVDQFEELFRFKRSRRASGRDEAVAFVKLLIAARASDAPCYIALTMRSDFIGDCMEFGNLPEIVNDGIYLVPRLTRDELRLVITGPVAVGGGTIAPRLVARLLNDVGDDPDQLPILQHALMRTWEYWDRDHAAGEPLDLRHYDAIGTMSTALSRHAEEAFGELNEQQQAHAAKMFKALTDKESDVRGVRRPASVDEICAVTGATEPQIVAIVDRFREHGRTFLMPSAGTPLQAKSIVDISHESLMRVWTRLSGWAGEEARSAQLYERIARAAERHERGEAALWRDPELQLALDWRQNTTPTPVWAARYDPSFERAMAFLDASRAARDREVREKRMRRRVLLAILVASSLAIAAFGVIALLQKWEAERLMAVAQSAEKRSAESALKELQMRDRADAHRANAERAKRNAEEEKKNALEQKRFAEAQRMEAQKQTVVAQNETKRADAARVEAIHNEQEAKRQKAEAELARSNEEREKKTALRLSDLATSRALALSIPRLGGLAAGSALKAYRLHRDNQGSPSDRPELYAAMRLALEGTQPPIVVRGEQAIRTMALLPDGRSALTGGDDGRMFRVDLAGAKTSLFKTIPSPVRAIAIRPAGDLAAVGGADGKIRIWDLRKPDDPPRELVAGTAPVSSIAFQPGGSRLAAGSLDGKVWIWSLGDDKSEPVVLSSPAGTRVTAIAISPDGKRLLAGFDGKADAVGAHIWSLEKPSGPQMVACRDMEVRSVAISPDGEGIACGSTRGRIHYWKMGGGLAALVGHESAVNALTFDRQSTTLASASSDGTVRLWDVTEPEYGPGKVRLPIVLRGHDSWVWAASFTPDGERLITAGEDRSIRFWPASTDVLAAELCSATRSTDPPCPVKR